MAPPVKLSKAIVSFLCDKIEDGITISKICKEYKHHELVPEEKTIYRWKKKYPEFKVALNEAYQTFFYKKMDELEDLSEEYKQIEEELAVLSDAAGKDRVHFNKFKAALMSSKDHRDNVKMRIDTLKFILGKLAPKLVTELADQSKQIVAPTSIVVVNYKDQRPDEANLTRVLSSLNDK